MRSQVTLFLNTLWNIVPVNPTITEVLGKTSYPTIEDIPEKIDIVDIFRRSEDVPSVRYSQ